MAPRGEGRWADNRRVRAHADHPSYAFPVISHKVEIRSNAATGLRPISGPPPHVTIGTTFHGECPHGSIVTYAERMWDAPARMAYKYV